MDLLLLLGKGMVVTIQLFLLTLIFALPLGLVVSFGRRSKSFIINGLTGIYISIMRGTPLILQLVAVYFGPYYIFGGKIDRFTAAIIAFSLNYAAYFAEIYRGGIESIPRGQYEAGEVLGFTKAQVFFKIILPQVIKRILPAISNEVITLVKDTALVTTIGVAEMFRAANNEMSRIASIQPLFVAGVFYYIMNLVVAQVFKFTEKKLSYYR
ncbi:amino acid ABC transporter permease [Ruminiclostridium cellobioparum]|uniref:Amine acid ABC transporter, permease protein, 3-TM region, His/Glu/Gln/Arg/opine family n=1 Tax=Ruminiclostridium cellobioparum subsp. termitidis CT1112 TaxID=1195236 RepID=S0FHK9_RUMCE|nr:amino acid ABC transporter permease [Ruminiclostridium cellobioparum]EMS70947.1 amine acid ABC transporter, permease protein, 3-TM region, His/Glu/Gln/Arg/opine family [Ruminiclostridium cellobioparum subsp. termitidis CT1112]